MVEQVLYSYRVTRCMHWIDSRLLTVLLTSTTFHGQNRKQSKKWCSCVLNGVFALLDHRTFFLSFCFYEPNIYVHVAFEIWHVRADDDITSAHFLLFWVPVGLAVCGGDVMVHVFDINQPSLSIPLYSVLVFFSVIMALSAVLHSLNSLDNSPLSHSVLPALYLPYLSFQLYMILCGWLGLKH